MAENIFRLVDDLTAITKRLRKALEELVGNVAPSQQLKLSSGLSKYERPYESSTEESAGSKIPFSALKSYGLQTPYEPPSSEGMVTNSQVSFPKMPTINPEPVKAKKVKGPVSDARRMQGQWMAALRVLAPEDQLEAKRLRFSGEPGAFVSAIEWAKTKGVANKAVQST